MAHLPVLSEVQDLFQEFGEDDEDGLVIADPAPRQTTY